MGLDEDDAEIMKDIARHLRSIATVATETAAAEDPATNHLEKIATAVSLLAESEERVADGFAERHAAVKETDEVNHRVALLNEQIRAESTKADVGSVMTRIAKLPTLEAALRAIARGDGPAIEIARRALEET